MFARLRTRLLLSGIVTVIIVVGLIAFLGLIQTDFNGRVRYVNAVSQSLTQSRELSLYTQYNAHDTSAYALGHLEHRQEFDEHAAVFSSLLDQIQQAITTGILEEDEQTQIDKIRTTRAQYDRAAEAFFTAVDANRSNPSATNQAAEDAAWQAVDQLGDQLDEESAELARRITSDLNNGLPAMSTRNDQILAAMGILGIVLITVIVFVQVMAAQAVGTPLRTLLAGVQEFTAGNLGMRLAVKRRDEVGDLANAFNQMAETLQEQRAALEVRNQELQQSLQKQQQLFSTVQELSAPLLPIGQGLVLLPLVGHVDAGRAQAMLKTLLHGVAQHRAYCAILDVTGIARIDDEVLRLLLQMVEATELLGAQVMLAGISAGMAQAIVTQDVDIGRLRTYRDLGSAIDAAHGLRKQAMSNGASAVAL